MSLVNHIIEIFLGMGIAKERRCYKVKGACHWLNTYLEWSLYRLNSELTLATRYLPKLNELSDLYLEYFKKVYHVLTEPHFVVRILLLRIVILSSHSSSWWCHVIVLEYFWFVSVWITLMYLHSVSGECHKKFSAVISCLGFIDIVQVQFSAFGCSLI